MAVILAHGIVEHHSNAQPIAKFKVSAKLNGQPTMV